MHTGDRTIRDLTSLPGGVVLAATERGVLRSEDNGSTWSESLPGGGACFNTVESDNEGVAVLDDKFLSYDGGLTWNPYSEELPGRIMSLAFDSAGVLYAGTLGWGIYKTTSPVSTSSKNPEQGASTMKAALYPNPASDNVQVKLLLDEAASLSVDLYDALGRLVTSRSPETAGPGNENIELDLSGLRAGVYLVRVYAGAIYQDLTLAVIN